MQQTSLGEYLKAPLGKWVSGDGWLHFFATEPYLVGALMWGHLDEAVIDVLLRCATAVNVPATPHTCIVDGGRALSYDPAIFAMVSNYLVHNVKRLGSVTKLVGIRPPGGGGALAEGFFRVVPAPYPVQVFSERSEGLDWLGCLQHASAIEEIEHLAAAVSATSRILGELHRVIEKRITDPDLARTAKELGLSVRSMQRHLRTEGTSFQQEVSLVRVRVAQRLILDKDLSLAEVATSSGFSSAAKLSAAFRKLAGMTPTEWRDARR